MMNSINMEHVGMCWYAVNDMDEENYINIIIIEISIMF